MLVSIPLCSTEHRRLNAEQKLWFFFFLPLNLMNESCVCLISHTLVALLTDDLQRELRMGLIVFCTAHRILLYKKKFLDLHCPISDWKRKEDYQSLKVLSISLRWWNNEQSLSTKALQIEVLALCVSRRDPGVFTPVRNEGLVAPKHTNLSSKCWLPIDSGAQCQQGDIFHFDWNSLYLFYSSEA